MNTVELINWAKERHDLYCMLADAFLQKFGKVFIKPRFELFAKPTKCAARAWTISGYCEYNLVYLIAVETRYDDTIAHEIAHHIVHQLGSRYRSHGELFLFVFNDVFCKLRGRYHNYSYSAEDVAKAKAILKLIDMNKVVADTKESS